MSAPRAGVGLHSQSRIVLRRQGVPGPGQVVVLVDQAYVQPGRAWAAVVAVHASSLRLGRGERPYDGVVPVIGRRIQVRQRRPQVVAVPHTGQDGDDARLVQGVLDALGSGQGPAEGRDLRVGELAASERLHDGDPDTVGFASAVQIRPLADLAVGELPLLPVVRGVDAEHDHVYDSRVQRLLGDGWGVGGNAYVVNCPLVLQLLDVIDDASVPLVVKLREAVDAVYEAVVDVVRADLGHLPLYRLPDVVQAVNPAVLAGGVVGPEVHLEHGLLAPPLQGLPERAEGHAGG